jgi:hypothetical protein
MTRDELLRFLHKHRICVQSSVSAAGAPQCAVIGFAISDRLEIVFDTLVTTRKLQNLRRDSRIALVIGWDEETAQIEGVADEPNGHDLERLKTVYFAAYPDGVERLKWEGITYVRVRPTWVRYSDYRGPAPHIVELHEQELIASP